MSQRLTGPHPVALADAPRTLYDRHPVMKTYVYQPETRVSFDEAVALLRQQGRTVVNGQVDMTSPATVARIRELAGQCGLEFKPLDIDVQSFNAYFEAAGYRDRFPTYYPGNQYEKALEHFIALSLLKLGPADIFVDVASEHSPVPNIYARLTGAATYSQDIMYPSGISGHRIGGDACAMPVADGFATAASLTCSLEHFEQDADLRLFVELGRILRPGGAVCVVPFYLNVGHVIQTDPTVGVPANVVFDPGAPVYCVGSWGNRHARFYSPQSFNERIMKHVEDRFRFEFFHVPNAQTVHPSVYLRFAFLATKR